MQPAFARSLATRIKCIFLRNERLEALLEPSHFDYSQECIKDNENDTLNIASVVSASVGMGVLAALAFTCFWKHGYWLVVVAMQSCKPVCVSLHTYMIKKT